MTHTLIPIHALKGCGSATRMQHRFEKDTRIAWDDGWNTLEDASLVNAPRLETEVIVEDARSVINRNESPDIHFDYSVNPCRGCEHGCVYCFARPTHSHLNLSPGLDFETKIMPNATSLECCAPIWESEAMCQSCSTSAQPRIATSPWSVNYGSRAGSLS